MNIVEISYGITRNLGDFNSERVDAKCQLQEGENPEVAMLTLKNFVITGKVSENINSNTASGQKIEPETQVVPEEPKKEEKPKSKAKKEKKEEVVAPPQEKEEEEAKPTKRVLKGTTYNRDMELHKKLYVEALTKICPTWRTNPEKAKEISLKLAGHEFLDTEGSVIPSFSNKLMELWNG